MSMTLPIKLKKRSKQWEEGIKKVSSEPFNVIAQDDQVRGARSGSESAKSVETACVILASLAECNVSIMAIGSKFFLFQ